MGICLTSESSASQEITRQMHREEVFEHDMVKLLLLGTGNTGKTTWYRQFQLALGKGLSEKEREAVRVHIEEQIIQHMQLLAELSLQAKDFHELPPQFRLDEAKREVIHSAQHMKEVDYCEGFNITLIDHIKTLWNDPTIQLIFRNHRTVQSELRVKAPFSFPESCEYFWNDIDRISLYDYKPNSQDVVQLRHPTSGAVTFRFHWENQDYSVVDIGGQRCQRPKWLNFFHDMHAVLYVISLTAYDEVLYEDGQTNAMDEQLKVFEETINRGEFENATFILFFNKTDLLKRKIEEERYLTMYFDDYTGPHDFGSYCRFITQKFLERNKNKHRHIYIHQTCATDTKQAEQVLKDVTRESVVAGLKKVGLGYD